jgi:hypothetical protein
MYLSLYGDLRIFSYISGLNLMSMSDLFYLKRAGVAEPPKKHQLTRFIVKMVLSDWSF